MHDKCASQKFLAGHVQDVAASIRSVDEHHGGCASVVLTGSLSTKSVFFIDNVSAAVGRELRFVGTWMSSEDARFAKISAAVAHATSTKRM